MKKHSKKTALPINNASQCMPHGNKEKKILAVRREWLAKKPNQQKQQNNQLQYIQFQLGHNERYGIPYQIIDEVIMHQSITPAPKTPAFIAGVINRRGKLLTVFDLKKFFNLNTTENNHQPSLIIISNQGITISILVDHIEGSAYYNANQLSEGISTEKIKPNYIMGLDKGITTLLNMSGILADIKRFIK